MRSFSPKALVPVYLVGVLGAFLQIAGAQWDVSAHIVGIVETFFTPAHTVLYAGIGLVALANFQGLRLRLANASASLEHASLFSGLRIALLGSILQLVAGPIDFYWHSTKGFDPYLFTPPHSLLILGVVLGGIGMTLGAVRLLQAQRVGLELTRVKWLLPVVAIVGLASLWGQFNFADYWLTDLRGMAWTFGLCNSSQFFPPVSCSFVKTYDIVASLVSFVIFAANGTFFFWAAKKLFPRKGIATITSVVLESIYAGLALGFLAYSLAYLNPPGSFYFVNPTPQSGFQLASTIPVYLLSLVPVVLLDLGLRRDLTTRKLIVASIPVGPFAALVDGRFAIQILGIGIESLALVSIFTIIGGIIGGVLFTNVSTRIPLTLVTSTRLKTGPPIPAQLSGNSSNS